MKRIIPLLLLALSACETQNQRTYAITVPPAMLANASTTALLVPKTCPAYAPGGGDVDTPEPPFPPKVTMLCGVDASGATYGLVGGDAPTARLAVLPGNQELGLYIGVDASARFTPDKVTLNETSASIQAWAAPVNVEGRTSCCAEDIPNSSLKLLLVAAGTQGMMISLGKFDDKPTQVAFELNPAALFGADPGYGANWNGRFYVNGSP
jgi:hypothetical protein